jgi:three-Cys-motif partner protein
MAREWGPHSEEKIQLLRDYLTAFAKAAGGARHRVYIEGFGGELENILKTTGARFPGSLETALAVSPSFTHVLACEKGKARAKSLRDALGSEVVTVLDGDCNKVLPSALRRLPVEAPTFAFLDPDGLQLHWILVKAIADHRREYAASAGKTKAEQFILFPSQSALRCLSTQPTSVARVFGGSGPWERLRDLYDDTNGADVRDALTNLYMERLVDLGYRYVSARPMKPDGQGELYVLVFASDHPAGQRIMGAVANKPRTRQRLTLFDLEEAREAWPFDPEWRSDWDDLGDWDNL